MNTASDRVGPTRSGAPHRAERLTGHLQILHDFLRQKIGAYDGELYVLGLDGACMEPLANNGDWALVAPTMPFGSGDLVVLWPKNASLLPQLKRVVVSPPDGWQNWHSDSEAEPLIVVEMLNPATRLYVRTAQLSAIHRVLTWFAPGTCTFRRPPAKRQRRARGART